MQQYQIKTKSKVMVSLSLVLFLYAMKCIFSSWPWCGNDNMSTSNNSPHSSGNNRYDNKVGTGCLGPQDDTPYRASYLQDKLSNSAYQENAVMNLQS